MILASSLYQSLKVISDTLTSGSYSHTTFTLKANLATGSPSSFNDDTLTLENDIEVFEFVCVSAIVK